MTRRILIRPSTNHTDEPEVQPTDEDPTIPSLGEEREAQLDRIAEALAGLPD